MRKSQADSGPFGTGEGKTFTKGRKEEGKRGVLDFFVRVAIYRKYEVNLEHYTNEKICKSFTKYNTRKQNNSSNRIYKVKSLKIN